MTPLWIAIDMRGGYCVRPNARVKAILFVFAIRQRASARSRLMPLAYPIIVSDVKMAEK